MSQLVGKFTHDAACEAHGAMTMNSNSTSNFQIIILVLMFSLLIQAADELDDKCGEML